jgi:hypothetical protein
MSKVLDNCNIENEPSVTGLFGLPVGSLPFKQSLECQMSTANFSVHFPGSVEVVLRIPSRPVYYTRISGQFLTETKSNIAYSLYPQWPCTSIRFFQAGGSVQHLHYPAPLVVTHIDADQVVVQ